MASSTPQNANEFIERQLDNRAEVLEGKLNGDVLAITGALIIGLDDAVRTVLEDVKQASDRNKLVVVLTTRGGYIEPVHRMADTMRHYYEIVDFIIPNHAYSAGTILALSGDSIYMNYYSRLGPVDPQVEGPNGMSVPALGYLVQWDRLIKKARAGKLTTEEAQLMIYGFDQATLYMYEQERELSIALLKEWLVQYKFKDWNVTETRRLKVTPKLKEQRAARIARELNNTDKWHSHGYGISMEVLKNDLNLKIDDFDEDAELSTCIKDYYNLLDDYITKRGDGGTLHMKGIYVPFQTHFI